MTHGLDTRTSACNSSLTGFDLLRRLAGICPAVPHPGELAQPCVLRFMPKKALDRHTPEPSEQSVQELERLLQIIF